ncbi:MAG: 23S rRNA (guanosine2251-2'-O)-methyltransferase [Spirosomataceae bacterium]|jgi:tRNA G18 (ribose-2'-O)-methylase SpoU
MKKLSLEELNRMDVDAFKESDKHPFCFVLDDIRSRNNVGTFFRTADAFRAEKIYLCGITPVPPHRDIEKTAIGATESVNFEFVDNAMTLLTNLRSQGYIIAAVEQVEYSQKLNNFKPKKGKKYAFVLGNEVFGVNQEIVDFADICLEIPQFGTKHSLNVAVSAGIIAWDFYSKISQ